MGKGTHDINESSCFRVKKQGIRIKTSVGSRFIGCSLDSSQRSFGRIPVSKAFLTAMIYAYSRERGVVVKIPGGD